MYKARTFRHQGHPRTGQIKAAYGGSRRCAGLSLVETLIALAIAALLLSATAMAFDAAFGSYKANHDLAITSMSARNCLYQMCSTIRSAWNDPDYDTIDVSTDGTECALVDANGRAVIYWYDGATNQLKVNINAGVKWYVLLDKVTPISVGDKVFESLDPEGGDFDAGTVGCVKINFKVDQGQASRTVSAAVVPRNVVYSD